MKIVNNLMKILGNFDGNFDEILGKFEKIFRKQIFRSFFES